MQQSNVRHAFLLFHITLGLVLFLLSARTAFAAVGAPNWYLSAFATVEAIAAILFLIPSTKRLAGWALCTILLTAFGLHAAADDVQLQLLVFAAGTLFVTTHGSTIDKCHLQQMLLTSLRK